MDDLDHEVRVRFQSKLLVAHVHIWVAIFKVFELFPRKEAVVFSLGLNFYSVLHLEVLLDDRLLYLSPDFVPFCQLLLFEGRLFLFVTAALAAKLTLTAQFFSQAS